MRSGVRRPRTAGYRSTGTLTSPNVSVPLQNARAFGRASGSAAMTRSRVLPARLEARLQAGHERIGALALGRLREAHNFARGFGGDHAPDLLLIFVAKFARVETVFERADQLLGQRNLTLVGRTVRVGPHRADLDDLLRITQRIEQQ